MHEDLVACSQFMQVYKWAILTVLQGDMASQYTVAGVSGEGTAFQPASIIEQPVDIPGIILQGNADNR